MNSGSSRVTLSGREGCGFKNQKETKSHPLLFQTLPVPSPTSYEIEDQWLQLPLAYIQTHPPTKKKKKHILELVKQKDASTENWEGRIQRKGADLWEKKSQKPRPSNKDCPRIQNSLGEFVCQQLKLNKRTKQRRLCRKKEKKTGEEVGYSDCSQHHVSWPHVVYNSLEGPWHGHNYASLCRWGSRGMRSRIYLSLPHCWHVEEICSKL